MHIGSTRLYAGEVESPGGQSISTDGSRGLADINSVDTAAVGDGDQARSWVLGIGKIRWTASGRTH